MEEKISNKDKRKPKGELKMNLPLTEEQKAVKAQVLQDTVSVLYGPAGTSKTFLAVNIALDLFFKREINQIIIARPTVATEDIGLLPGTISDKMEPWLIPILHNMYILAGKEKIDTLIAEGDIEFMPLQFIQGVTFVDAIAILDESQNATKEQIKMFLTRIGKGSKVLLTGDTDQVVLRKKDSSGLGSLISLQGLVPAFNAYELTENHRDPIVLEILKHYK